MVGLGNPGKKYELTRHNFGFLTVAQLLNLFSKEINQKLIFSSSTKFKSEICQFIYGDKKVILAKPQTFMNLSGQAAKIFHYFYKPEKIIVIYDDLYLPLGTIRMRDDGESGGHKGVEDIIQHIGNDFFRVKLGIGPQPKNLSGEKFVLQNFSQEELISVEKAINLASEKLLEKIKQNNFEPITLAI